MTVSQWMDDMYFLSKERYKDMSFFNQLFWFIALDIGLTWKLIRTENDPYLFRVYLYRGKWFRHIYLHYFFRSDLDRDVHNHPVDEGMTSYSLILTKGYKEERLAQARSGHQTLVTKQVKPFRINKLYSNTFHKVTLNKGNPWTLFFPGWKSQDPAKEEWGFYDFSRQKYTPWEIYVKQRDE